jgi:hypothetical protein
VSVIAVVVVSWHDGEDLAELVSSLAAARRAVEPGGPRATLTVVVNGGRGSISEDRLRADWPDAVVLWNDVNRGLGPAANQGVAAGGAAAEALLFVNPDARAEGDPFSALARGFAENPAAVALAPRLLPEEGAAAANPSGRLAPPGSEDQFTFQLRALPRLASDARELLLVDHLFPENAGRRRARYADRPRDAPFPVAQAAGAAFAVRGDAFRRVGGFDERFVPAWFEDVDLCARLGRLGTILYWPAARFRHRGGASAERLGYSRFLPVYYANALRYRGAHYGLAARAVYRLLLAAGMLLRIAALPLRRRDPRPKRESLRAYLRVLRVVFGFRVGAREPPAVDS